MPLDDRRHPWFDVFSGRTRELELLRDAWSRVAAPQPEPQVVVLLAEAGLGKTRLVQEFYQHLSTTVDGTGDAGYWPDRVLRHGDHLGLNPDPARCRPERSMPYLWWALRAQDPLSKGATPGESVSSSLGALRPHLQNTVRAARRAELQKRGRTLARKVGEDAAVMAGDALTFGLLGAVRSTAQHVNEYFSLRKERGELDEPVDLGSFQQQERDTVVDKIVGDLGLLLTVPFPGQAPVPAVVVVDDAQFAEQDSTLVELVDRLVYRARTNRWPLLVLLTHWEHRWHQAAAGGADALPNRLTRRLGTDWSPYTMGKVDDLGSMLSAGLSGLTAHQRDVLLKKADGNPQLLDEIMRRLRSRPRYFADRDPASALNARGEDEVTKTDFNLHALVEERLLAAPRAVREAVALSSVQGMRFVESLTLRSLEALGVSDPSTADALQEAERPYALVTSAGEGVGEFAQRAYYEVATDTLVDVADEDEATAAVLQGLHSIAGDAELFPALPESAKGVARDIAISLLDEHGSGQADGSLLARCLATAAGAAIEDWDYARAAAYAGLFVNAVKSGKAGVDALSLSELGGLLDAGYQGGALDAAELQALTDVVHDAVAGMDLTTPGLCQVLEHVIVANASSRGWFAAERHLRELLGAAQTLSATEGGSEQAFWMYKAKALTGNAREATAGPEAAESFYREALRHAYEALERDDSIRNRRAVMAALQMVARVVGARGGPKSTARKPDADAWRLAEEVAALEPSPRSRRDLAFARLAVGRTSADPVVVEEALGELRQLAAEHGARHARADLVAALRETAHRMSADDESRANLYAEALKLTRDLALERDGRGVRRILASLLASWAGAVRRTEPRRATAAFEEARALSRSIVEEHEAAWSLTLASGIMRRFAEHSATTGAEGAGRSLHAEAIEMRRRLAQRWPSASASRALAIEQVLALELQDRSARVAPSAAPTSALGYADLDATGRSLAQAELQDVITTLESLIGAAPADLICEATEFGLPFYPGWTLLRLDMRFPDAPSQFHGDLLRSADGVVLPLDGRSDLVHLMSQRAPLALDDANAIPFLRFFCQFVKGEAGPFLVANDWRGIPWQPHITETKKYADLEREYRPPAAARVDPEEGATVGGGWAVDAWVIYGVAAFRSVFEVDRGGTVTMRSDEPLVHGPTVLVPFAERARGEWDLYRGWPLRDSPWSSGADDTLRTYCEVYLPYGRLEECDGDEALLAQIHELAEAGSAPARALLGQAYRIGLGVDVDEERAMRLLLHAAEAGEARAMSALSFMYLWGPQDRVDAAESEALRRRAFDAGNEFGGLRVADKPVWLCALLNRWVGVSWDTPISALLALAHGLRRSEGHTPDEDETTRMEVEEEQAMSDLRGRALAWMEWDAEARHWTIDPGVLDQLGPLRRSFRGPAGFATFLRTGQGITRRPELNPVPRLVDMTIVSELYRRPKRDKEDVLALAGSEHRDVFEHAYDRLVLAGVIQED